MRRNIHFQLEWSKQRFNLSYFPVSTFVHAALAVVVSQWLRMSTDYRQPNSYTRANKEIYHTCGHTRLLCTEGTRPEMPLLPTEDGKEVGKAAAVATILGLGESIGERLMDQHGVYRFGGHSLRTGGAHYLAGLGVNML